MPVQRWRTKAHTQDQFASLARLWLEGPAPKEAHYTKQVTVTSHERVEVWFDETRIGEIYLRGVEWDRNKQRADVGQYLLAVAREGRLEATISCLTATVNRQRVVLCFGRTVPDWAVILRVEFEILLVIRPNIVWMFERA